MKTLRPETLHAARLARALSLTQLSEECGVSTQSLSRMERGEREASVAETASIATALELPVAALCRPIVSDQLGLSAFYHRKLAKAGTRVVNAIQNQCVLDVVALRELVAMVQVDYPSAVPYIDPDDIKNGDIEDAANTLRLAWKLPRGPIRDLCAVVERAGCFIIHSDFGVSEMDALYHKVAGMPPIFWVNSRKPLDRVRWSIGHELGHLVLHEDTPTNDIKLAEDQANKFSSAFLMPRSDFRSECPSRLGISELVELKRRWRCSMQAIVRRARSVGRITERDYRNLMITISRKGWKTREPYPIAGETPTLLAGIVDMCLKRLRMTDEELAEHIAVPVSKLLEWKQLFPGQRPHDEDGESRLRLVT